MPNTANPTVPVTLDKPRTMLIDLNAMEAFEELTGHGLLNGDERTGDFLQTAKGVKALLWASLIHEDPELTPSEVGKMVHTGNLRELNAQLLGAYKMAMPEEEADQGPPAQSLPPG